jgi:hypothetical protein
MSVAQAHAKGRSFIEPSYALKHDEIKLNRHCERSEAIHRAARTEWIASSLSLLATTTKSVIEPEMIVL